MNDAFILTKWGKSLEWLENFIGIDSQWTGFTVGIILLLLVIISFIPPLILGYKYIKHSGNSYNPSKKGLVISMIVTVVMIILFILFRALIGAEEPDWHPPETCLEASASIGCDDYFNNLNESYEFALIINNCEDWYSSYLWYDTPFKDIPSYCKNPEDGGDEIGVTPELIEAPLVIY